MSDHEFAGANAKGVRNQGKGGRHLDYVGNDGHAVPNERLPPLVDLRPLAFFLR